MYVHEQMCAVSMEERRGCITPWVWSYRYLLATIWVLRPLSTGRVASVLDCRTISQHPVFSFKNKLYNAICVACYISYRCN